MAPELKYVRVYDAGDPEATVPPLGIPSILVEFTSNRGYLLYKEEGRLIADLKYGPIQFFPDEYPAILKGEIFEELEEAGRIWRLFAFKPVEPKNPRATLVAPDRDFDPRPEITPHRHTSHIRIRESDPPPEEVSIPVATATIRAVIHIEEDAPLPKYVLRDEPIPRTAIHE